MLQNYFKTAFRNLFKNKLYSFINIGGLALGMAIAILIALYVQHELNYDKWINGHEQVHRVYRHWLGGGKTAWTPDPLAEALVEHLPEVNKAAGVSNYGEVLMEYEQEKIYVKRAAMADSTFLSVVELPLLYGNPKEALKAPNAVVLSKRVAEAFFGPVNPVGKSMRFNDEIDLTVGGVLDEYPGDTHLDYELYTRYTYSSPNWTGNNRATYVRLNAEAVVPQVEKKMTELVKPHFVAQMKEMGVVVKEEDIARWELQPMDDIHLYSGEIGWRTQTGGDIKYIYIFGVIALIVLLIASINYINLSTARAMNRAREVGVRKATGARRDQLVMQFLSETLVQTFTALVLAVVLAQVFLPTFNQIIDRELIFLNGAWAQYIPAMLLLVLLVSLLAGSYPAFVLSGFQPVKVLKGVLKRSSGGQLFRRALVVSQFSLSVVLVIVMLFIYRQMNYMMAQDLGFSGDQVLLIPLNKDDSHRKLESMKDAFLSIQGVKSLTTASRMPGHSYPDWGMNVEGKTDPIYPRTMFADADYAITLGLEVVEGRFLAADRPLDTLNNFIVNEAFVRDYQIENPIGQKLKFMGEEEYGQIVGVIKDYHYRGLDGKIDPLIIGGHHDRYYTAIKVSPEQLTTTIASIRNLWEQVEAAHPMVHSFLDESFQKQYNEYERFGKTLLYATILAIFLAVLGLFGLATYAAITRTKEIGIRKVLGASIQGISFMLVKDFIRWVMVAGIIAVPFGYLLSKRWLEDFAYRTDMSIYPFLLSIGAAILIAALTVSFQAIRAALANPVEALKYE